MTYAQRHKFEPASEMKSSSLSHDCISRRRKNEGLVGRMRLINLMVIAAYMVQQSKVSTYLPVEVILTLPRKQFIPLTAPRHVKD